MITLLLAATLILNTAGKPVIHQSINVDETRAIHFTDEVNKASADHFIGELQGLNGSKPVWVVINSGGGSISEGFRMENAIDQAKKEHPVNCIVEVRAMSMAAGLLGHCSVRYMEPGSELLYHTGSTAAQGERLTVIAQIAHDKAMFDYMDADNATHLHIPLLTYMDRIRDGGWYLTAEQACEAGAADAIVDGYISPVKLQTLQITDPDSPDWFTQVFGP